MSTPTQCREGRSTVHSLLLLAAALVLVAPAPAGTAGPDRAAVVPATDSVVVVVSSQSPVTRVTYNQLADIYMGRPTRLADGPAVVPVDQRSGSQARASFYRAYLGRTEAQMKAHWSQIIFTGRGRPPAEARTHEEVRTMVAANPRAVGYIDPSFVDASVRVLRVEGSR